MLASIQNVNSKTKILWALGIIAIIAIFFYTYLAKDMEDKLEPENSNPITVPGQEAHPGREGT